MTPADIRRTLQQVIQDAPSLAVHETLDIPPKEFMLKAIFVLNCTLRRHNIGLTIALSTRYGARRGIGVIRVKTTKGPVQLEATWDSKYFECASLKFGVGDAQAKATAVAFLIDMLIKALPPVSTAASAAGLQPL